MKSNTLLFKSALVVGLSTAYITERERALITAAPDISEARQVERQVLGATCAFVSGDPNSPLSCPGSSVCSYYGASWGCCDALGCVAPQTCEGFGTPYCGNVGSVNCVYTSIQQCTNANSPACVKYIRETGNADTAKKTSWGCAPGSTTILVLAEATSTATSGSTSEITSSVVEGTQASSTSNDSSSTSSSAASPQTSSSSSSGLSTSDKIALGVGIGVGLPGAIVALALIIAWIRTCLGRGSTGG